MIPVISGETSNNATAISEHPNIIHIPQKNKLILKIEHNGYWFLRSKVTKTSTYWVCDKSKTKNCRARMTIFNNTGCYQITNNVHTHLPCGPNKSGL